MSEPITVSGHKYKIGRLPAMRQFHVMRRLSGILAALVAAAPKSSTLGPGAPTVFLEKMKEKDVVFLLEAIVTELSSMPDEEAEYVILTCLSCVERKSGPGWARVVADDALMFEDLTMAAMLTLTGHVLKDHFSGFFDALPGGIPGAARTPTSTPSE